MNRWYFLPALVLAGAMIPAAAGAEVLKFEFEGTVTLDTYVARVGEKVTGAFSYATDTPLVSTCAFEVCRYRAEDHRITAQVGAHRITSYALVAEIQNNQGAPGFEDVALIGSGTSAVLDGTTYPLGGFGLQLISSKRNLFDDASLPHHYQVHRFDTVRDGYFTPGDGTALLYFQVDSIKRVKP